MNKLEVQNISQKEHAWENKAWWMISSQNRRCENIGLSKRMIRRINKIMI